MQNSDNLHYIGTLRFAPANHADVKQLIWTYNDPQKSIGLISNSVSFGLAESVPGSVVMNGNET